MIALCRLGAAAGVVLLAGCATFGSDSGHLPGEGLAVADEPSAAQVGAAELAHGGNAADAVAAIYFALAVTYPVAGGLGGGGLCLVHEVGGSKTASIDFLPRQAKQGGAYAIPGNVSGFAFLQAAYGRLPWQRVISPAESRAAAGFVVSRALAARLSASVDVVRLDAGLAAEFLDEGGHVKPAGARATAPALAQTLSEIRSSGAAGFYRGTIASEMVDYDNREGGALSLSGLERYAPDENSPETIKIGNDAVILPSSSTAAGKFAGALFSHLIDANGNVIAGRSGLPEKVAAATSAAMTAFGGASLPKDLGESGFAAADDEGMIVSCAVTMNGPFGSGHTVTGTGVTLANAPNGAQMRLASAFLTPAIALSDGNLFLVGAAAGGPNGSAGIVLALLQAIEGEDVLRPGALRPTGLEPFDTVNVIGCYNGVCAAIPDPGAYGSGMAGGPS